MVAARRSQERSARRAHDAFGLRPARSHTRGPPRPPLHHPEPCSASCPPPSCSSPPAPARAPPNTPARTSSRPRSSTTVFLHPRGWLPGGLRGTGPGVCLALSSIPGVPPFDRGDPRREPAGPREPAGLPRGPPRGVRQPGGVRGLRTPIPPTTDPDRGLQGQLEGRGGLRLLPQSLSGRRPAGPPCADGTPSVAPTTGLDRGCPRVGRGLGALVAPGAPPPGTLPQPPTCSTCSSPSRSTARCSRISSPGI